MTIAIFKLYANKIGGTEKAVQSLVSILNQNRYANECYAAVDVKEVQNSDDKCITLYNYESFLKKNK
ncbi:glycosyl transferase family 1, partial [Salmonella enterica subsp. enterica serovar Hvittingfoss]|nr:glycosyl transferase family 1 [Salmonella enterica]EBA3090808.1 glycosyl transferase family 1 [Salmonella enterica]EDR7238402.1 glycosyl transferase family 1 [Salmonella enterica subsp. enterica serovar Hvittingfoss]